MKAIVQDRYGSSDALELRDVEPPLVGDSEVLVRVGAAAVNAADWHIMRGDPYVARLVLGLGSPKAKIRGRDFAGRVEAVGKAVQRFQPGDEVYGEADGAFAEYICVAQDSIEQKPASLSFEQAAAVPLAGSTALVALRDLAKIQVGQQVLINGASGGVGTFAVQLGKAFAASVTGVCSTRNVELVTSLGAEDVIDYKKQDFTKTGQRYDVIFDLVGNRSLGDLRRALTPDGTLLLCGGGVSNGGSFLGPVSLTIKAALVSRFVRQRMVSFVVKQKSESLAALRELIEDGKVRPIIDRSYPLSDAAEAIRYLELEHARAKVVVTVSPGM